MKVMQVVFVFGTIYVTCFNNCMLPSVDECQGKLVHIIHVRHLLSIMVSVKTNLFHCNVNFACYRPIALDIFPI